MNKRKLLLAVFCISVIAACAFGITACAKHEHAYTESTVSPTCTERGYTLHSCECGDSYKDNYVDELGHDLENHGGQEASCTQVGYDAYQTCKRDGCNYSTYDEKPKLSHTVVTDAAVDPDCTNTGLTEGSHCDVCKTVLVEQTVIKANGHTPVTDSGKAASCTQTGLTEGSHCDVCKEVLVAQTEIPMNEHDIDGKNICSVCKNDLSTDGLTFTRNADGSYSVSGFGTATNVATVYVPAEYEGEPVTGISDYAFSYNKNVTAIYIPDTVTSLGKQAIRTCENLVTLSLPDSLETMGLQAIYNCNKLKYNIYGGVRYLGNKDNPYVVLMRPESLTITSCEVPEGTKIIVRDAFTIGDYDSCEDLVTVKLPSTLVTIYDGAFAYCKSLSNLTFGEGDNLKYIGSSAFDSCALTSVTVPDSVETIGKSAFSNNRISYLSVPFIGENKDGSGSNTYYSYIFGASQYNSNGRYGIYVKTLKISNADSIAANALNGCNYIETLILGKSVKSIGAGAFGGCTKLANVYYEGSAEEWAEVTVGGNNSYLTDHILYLSVDPAANCWHYVSSVPTKWVIEE